MSMRAANLPAVIEGFEERDEVSDLVGVQPKFRHARVPGRDTLRKRLGECLDRVSRMQRPERRRYLERTGRHAID